MKIEKDPHNCFVNLNYKCNNNCISCIREERNKLTQDPDFELIKREIDSISSYSTHIAFNGGEPTLRKDLLRIINYTSRKKLSIEISLLSNCRLFSNESYVLKLKKSINGSNFKIVTTIYGPNSKIHNAVTRTPDSFEQQMKGIKNLIKHGIKIELRIVINRINYLYLLEISEYITSNFENNDFIYAVFINQKIYGIAKDNYSLISYKLPEIIDKLQEAINELVKNNFQVKLFHFPHCILPEELWHLSMGKSAEESEIVFPPFCNRCLNKSRCSGIWKGYYELEGFHPNK